MMIIVIAGHGLPSLAGVASKIVIVIVTGEGGRHCCRRRHCHK